MLSRRNELLIGLAVMVFAAVVLWWLIPAYVALPRRTPINALAPSFWPKIICWLMLVCGAALTIRAAITACPPDAIVVKFAVSIAETLRLAGLIVILAATFFALPVFGMVWTSMVAFILLVLMSGGKNIGWGIVVGVLLPLLLYLFFTKVAGVAIPQGHFVRLP